MDWLSQNWIWIVLAVGAFFFMTRMGGGCGMGRSAGHHHHDEGRGSVPPSGGDSHRTTFDPVSRRSVEASGGTISSIYHGRAFYFENRENRDLFESDPEKYLAGAAGEPVEGEHEYAGEHRHRHGC